MSASNAMTVTLLANTAQTVTLNADLQHVEVTNINGAGPIYFTVAALEATLPTATVAGPGCLAIGAAVDAHREVAGAYDGRGVGQVSVISAAATTVTVRGW